MVTVSKTLISITSKVASPNLKENFISEAKKRGKKAQTLYEAVINYSIENKKEFKGALKSSHLEGGGKHVSIQVSPIIKENLKTWIDGDKTTMAEHVNYILLKAYEKNEASGGDFFDELI